MTDEEIKNNSPTAAVASSQDDTAFIREKIKERPINKKKLLRRTIITAALAIVFGLVACLTFLLLEPLFSARLTPAEEPEIITFPTSDDEIQPEDLYADDAEIASAQEQSVAESVAESIQASIEASEEDRINAAVSRALSRFSLDQSDAGDLYRSLKRVVSQSERSLVQVRAAATESDFIGGTALRSGEMPGLIIADNGLDVLILTYASILSEGDDLSVVFFGDHQSAASLKMSDPDAGLCVLSVPKRSLDEETRSAIAIAPLGSSISASLTGTPVIAVGSPIGIYPSVSYGMIASEKIAIDRTDKALKIFATDITGASHAHGFLLDYNGQVVGVIYPDLLEQVDADRILAYSISESKKLIEHLVNGTALPYLGIHGTNVTADAAALLGIEAGAYVLRTEMNSPAMEAGLQSGDVIVGLMEKPVTSWDALVSLLEDIKPGETIELDILRQGPAELLSMQLTITTEGIIS